MAPSTHLGCPRPCCALQSLGLCCDICIRDGMPKQSSVILSSRQLHLGKYRVSSTLCRDPDRVPSHHLQHGLHDDARRIRRHLLLTRRAQGRAELLTGFGCIVMFVSGMECQSNHQSLLAHGSSTSIHTYRIPSSVCRDPGRVPPFHIQHCPTI